MDRWIQTFTGKKFHPLEPERNEYDIWDIAHALSMKCRFGGHCKEFYSVAEHSIRVASIVAPENQLWALMHDAAEAYLPDVCSPIKSNVWIGEGKKRPWETPDQAEARYVEKFCLYFTRFDSIENGLLIHIADTFKLPRPGGNLIPDDVKQADRILLATEARDLLGKPPEPWQLCVPILPERIRPMPPAEAEQLFLKRFADYSEIGKAAVQEASC